MGTPLDIREHGTVIRFDADTLPTMEPRLFDADWLKDNQLWLGSAEGRGQAHFLRYADSDMVLRHFQRGGLVGRVIRDQFFRFGAVKSRAFREFDLLCEMRAAGLMVPRPLAARYAPSGLLYRAAIITERIPNAKTLQEILCNIPLQAPTWGAIGAAIKQMHNHSVFHSDLNCRNIMIDADENVWIIDFDKCETRTPGNWMQGNLDRLLRSLRKTAGQVPNLHWNEADWAILMAGYSDQGETA
ncbi:3-deoxy-D-manno-octulosonic acid kinase [uncultured Shimia sp.]|uniref:3-deoxy-D-manno-octulosonic acid kinase n=1 Tax=uncultured Shimia sp. TaxID=573152 RepID=UPI002626563B|nr:3-deoxy-D-manno-octulosonic acid kinase [uncultured Shimia sp.]